MNKKSPEYLKVKKVLEDHSQMMRALMDDGNCEGCGIGEEDGKAVIYIFVADQSMVDELPKEIDECR